MGGGLSSAGGGDAGGHALSCILQIFLARRAKRIRRLWLKTSLAVPNIGSGHVERLAREICATEIIDGEDRVDEDAALLVVHPKQILIENGTGTGGRDGKARFCEFDATDEAVEQGFATTADELEHGIRGVVVHDGIPVGAGKHVKANVDTELTDFLQITVGKLAVGFVEETNAIVLNEDGRVVGVLDGVEDGDRDAVTNEFGFTGNKFLDVGEAETLKIVAKLRAGEAADENGEIRRKMLQGGDIHVVLMLVGQKQVVDIFREGLGSDARISEDVGMKPGSQIRPFREPRVGEDLNAASLSESTGLAV